MNLSYQKIIIYDIQLYLYSQTDLLLLSTIYLFKKSFNNSKCFNNISTRNKKHQYLYIRILLKNIHCNKKKRSTINLILQKKENK